MGDKLKTITCTWYPTISFSFSTIAVLPKFICTNLAKGGSWYRNCILLEHCVFHYPWCGSLRVCICLKYLARTVTHISSRPLVVWHLALAWNRMKFCYWGAHFLWKTYLISSEQKRFEVPVIGIIQLIFFKCLLQNRYRDLQGHKCYMVDDVLDITSKPRTQKSPYWRARIILFWWDWDQNSLQLASVTSKYHTGGPWS